MKKEIQQDNRPFKSLRSLNAQKSAGFTFSAGILLPMAFAILYGIILSSCKIDVGDSKPDWYIYLSFAMPLLGFLVVALLMFLGAKIPVKEVTGKPHWKYFILAIVLQFGLLSLSELNGLFVGWLQSLGLSANAVNIPSTQGWGIVGVLAVVALLPAVFEEVIFRGLILRGLKDFGMVASVLLCGGLFALYHQNPAQTMYQFCCGVCFALIAFRSGSVFPTIVSHFINNAVILLYYHFTGNDTMPLPWYITVISAVCLAGSLAYLIFFDKKKSEIKPMQEGQKPDVKGFLLCVAVGVVVCLVTWISVLLPR